MANRKPSHSNTSFLLDIDGMKCGGCVRSVEKILLSQENVSNVSVNLVSRTAWLEIKENNDSNVSSILQVLNDRGFPAKKRSTEISEETTNQSIHAANQALKEWRNLIIAISLLLLSVLGHLAESGQLNQEILGSLGFHASLATIALIGPGLPILKGGVKDALALSPSMDTLVAMGVSSAYIASLVALIWPNVGWPCFFNEPVMLLGFVLLGRFLEERARFRTGKALKELSKLQPETARLVVNDDEIREIRVGALKTNEHIQLLAGDRIPVDGVVTKGNSAVDISSLTGEPLPIDASPGTELSAGSLNLESNLILEVKSVGAKTVLAEIIGLVEKAQARKAPIQSIADRIAGNFCYGVLGLAIITFLFWWQIGPILWPEVINTSTEEFLKGHLHHLHHGQIGVGAETSLGLAIQLSIAVLVVACPCALGLATPTVITVATGQAAKKGVLFKGGDVIEIASSIKEIIFDKTGTLTIGRPIVVGLSCTKDPIYLLQIAASLEENSRHPLAHAILQEAQNQNLLFLKTKAITTYPGKGIYGELEKTEGGIRIGKIEWLNEEGVYLDPDAINEIENESAKGNTIVGVAKNDQFLGIILINDQLRKDAVSALTRLRNQGMNLSILSGDRSSAVKRLAGDLGFDSNHLGWELLPNEKLLRLEKLKKIGRVAMVGDGINDAPALAAADLGIAIGTGTQIAQDSADLVLLGDRLENLPDALLLAQRSMQKIRQNLAWAFGYNLIALPLAAGFLLPGFGLLLSPPVAALLMAISSITVVINALSLRST